MLWLSPSTVRERLENVYSSSASERGRPPSCRVLGSMDAERPDGQGVLHRVLECGAFQDRRLGRVADVVALLAEQRPDVFALYEVEGKEVFDELTTQIPEYTFHITEGPQVQEILIGIRARIDSVLHTKSRVSLRRQAAAPRSAPHPHDRGRELSDALSASQAARIRAAGVAR